MLRPSQGGGEAPDEVGAGTLAGNGFRARRDAQTSGAPSATTTVAEPTSFRASVSLMARRRMSTFGVMIRPPRPSASSASTCATTSASTTQSNSIPASATRFQSPVTVPLSDQ